MTFEELKTTILEWLDADETRLSNAIRGQIINICQRDLIRKHDLRFAEYTQEITTIAGTDSYDVYTYYSRPYSMWYMDGTTRVNVSYLTKEDFDARFGTNTTQDTPTHYTVWGEKVYLGPNPDAVYTVKFNMYRLLPDLVDGAPNNTNEFVEYAWEVLLFRALWYATKYILEDERLPIWERDAMEKEVVLSREHARERAAHRRPVSNEPG